MGQPSKDFALPEERLASEKISEVRREECATACTYRMAQNPTTAPTHQTRSDENFVKAMDRTGPTFKYLAGKFRRLSKRKLQRGVYVGPQIRKLFKNDMFNNLLKGDEKKSLGRVLSGVN
jgi:hypothetical protein